MLKYIYLYTHIKGFIKKKWEYDKKAKCVNKGPK